METRPELKKNTTVFKCLRDLDPVGDPVEGLPVGGPGVQHERVLLTDVWICDGDKTKVGLARIYFDFFSDNLAKLRSKTRIYQVPVMYVCMATSPSW